MPSIPLVRRDSSTTLSSSESGMSAQVVVGVIVGAVVLSLFIAFAVWFLYKRYRRRRNPSPSSPNILYNPKLSRVTNIGRLLDPQPSSQFETKASDSRPLLSPEPSLTFHTKVDSSNTWAPSGVQYTNVAEEGTYHIDFSRLPTPTFCDQFGDRFLPSSLMEESPTPLLQSSFGSRHTSPQTSPPATPSPVPSPKNLPHLLIPGKDDPAIPASRYLLTRPIAKMKTPIESPPPISPSSSVSSESIYSQASASTRRHTMLSMYEAPPPVPPIPLAFRSNSGLRPLPQVPDDVLKRVREEEQGNLNRMPTKVIAGLVKGRVKRTKGADLDRHATKVSRIERADSIKSVATPSDDEDETTSMSLHYPRLERTRSRWEKRSQVRMDTVMESPSSASSDAYYAFNVSPLRVRKNYSPVS